MLQRLREMVDVLTAGAAARAKQIAMFDQQVLQLHEIGLILPTTIVGHILISRSWAGFGYYSDDGIQLIQPVLLSERGAAAAFWDADDYMNVGCSGWLAYEARQRCELLQDCSVAIQAILWPRFASMLDQLLNSLLLPVTAA